jgi:hypothetical protein
MAQGKVEPKAKEKLRERGYLDRMPPLISDQQALGPEQVRALEAYIR